MRLTYDERLKSLEEEIVNDIQNEGVFKSDHLPKAFNGRLTLGDLTENFEVTEWDDCHEYLRQSMSGAIYAECADKYYDALYRVVRDVFAKAIVESEIAEGYEI